MSSIATLPATDRTRELGVLLARRVREADDGVPAERCTRRTLAEMMPGYERQSLLVLHRPCMNDACAICGVWSCKGNCWQAAPAPADARVRAVAR